jgi:hypothetical protein
MACSLPLSLSLKLDCSPNRLFDPSSSFTSLVSGARDHSRKVALSLSHGAAGRLPTTAVENSDAHKRHLLTNARRVRSRNGLHRSKTRSPESPARDGRTVSGDIAQRRDCCHEAQSNTHRAALARRSASRRRTSFSQRFARLLPFCFLSFFS